MDLQKSIIGERVFHKFLKEGIVTSCDNQYIYVRFYNKEKTYRFKFPDIMLGPQPLLISNNASLNAFLQNAETDYTCTRCGKKVTEDLSLRPYHICNQCLSQMVKCVECGHLYERTECVEDYLGKTLCKTCASRTRFLCSHCGELYPLSKLVQSDMLPDGLKVCEDCICELDFMRCSCCNQYAPPEMLQEIDGYDVCPTCKEKFVGKCHICGCETVFTSTDTLITCNNCEEIIYYQRFIDSIGFSSMRVARVSFEEFRKSRTVRLMSCLRYSYTDTSSPKNRSIDLLVIDSLYGGLLVYYDKTKDLSPLARYGCTLTELKKHGVNHLFRGSTCIVKRTLPVPQTGKTFYVWERPYLLNAQTVSDMDYGDIWEGENLVFEGNKYEDTSPFVILGFVK